MSEEITIGFKAVAELALPDTCPRCFAVKNRFKPPFQSFPGVFNTLDKHCKSVYAGIPVAIRAALCIPDNAEISLEKSPHWSKFKLTRSGITVRGVADTILLVTPPGSLLIIDNKVAKKTENADSRFEQYVIQTNLYKLAAEACMGNKVHSLGLMYFDPETCAVADACMNIGFVMKYTPVETLPEADVLAYIDKAAALLLSPSLPFATHDCEDCTLLAAMAEGVTKLDTQREAA